MLRDQFISVTDLRTKTKKSLQGLQRNPKYILVNNKPIAVLVDIDVYEESFLAPKLVELQASEVSESLKKEAKLASKLKQKELINI